MSRIEKFMLNYALSVVAYIVYGAIGALLLLKLNFDWTAIGIMLAMMIGASGYSYINGWYRGRWDEQEERTKILREENASRISRKNKQKT